jgi:hypothetical protein
MASFDDLGQALRDDASANAPRASAIDVDAVTAAARARRRPRQWAVGTLSVVAALGLGGLAIGAVAPPTLIAASESADLEAGVADGAAPMAEGGGDQRVDGVDLADLVTCGADSTATEVDAGDLTLELRLPAGGESGGEPIGATAVLVNTGTDTLRLGTGTSALAVLEQNGIVVGAEVPQTLVLVQFELAPGQSRELPTAISTLDCRTAENEPLGSGRYGVIAVLEVSDLDTGVGTLVVAPPVEIRLD